MANKGNYYKLKSKAWLKEKGYYVEYLEQLHRIFAKGKVIWVKRDLLGADGCAVTDGDFILWNSILGVHNVAAHIKAFKAYPQGGTIKRWLICWTPRISEPEIIEVE